MAHHVEAGLDLSSFLAPDERESVTPNRRSRLRSAHADDPEPGQRERHREHAADRARAEDSDGRVLYGHVPVPGTVPEASPRRDERPQSQCRSRMPLVPSGHVPVPGTVSGV